MNLKEGDIFEFQVNEKNTGYGQIVSKFKKNAISVIIFKGLYKSRPDIKDLIEDGILLFANTFDAKLHHKHWIIIGNEKSNLEDIKLPYYKVGTGPVYIEDFFEKQIRKATRAEEDYLSYRSYVAPVRLETAFQAHYKLTDWNPVFDDLLYTNVVQISNLIEEL